MTTPFALHDLTFPRVLAHYRAVTPDKTVLTEWATGRSWTWATLDDWVQRIANALAGLGAGPGTHVGLLLDNSAEHIGVFLALARLGAVYVPVNTAARGQLLAYYLAQADARLVITDAHLAPHLGAVLEALTGVSQIMVVGRHGAATAPADCAVARPVVDFTTCVQAAAAVAPASTARHHDPLLLAWTSGTTGPSKASVHSQASALSYGTGGIEAHGYHAADVFYVCLPLFHVNALLTATATALVAGAAVVLAERFSASRFFADIRACGATTTNLLGAMTHFLWAQPPQPDDADNQLRLVSVSPLPAFTAEFEARFGLRAVSNYGLSDFATVTSLGAAAPRSKAGSIGVPRSYYDVRVVDDHDHEVPRGTVGELVLRSREPWRAATGYYKMPEATAAAQRNLWFHTGDRAHQDTDGYFWFVDRKKDCIRRRGENVSAFEVEQVLGTHPAVGAVAVFPVATAEGDEEVGAALVARAGCTLDLPELIAHCAHNLSYFMVPRYLQVVPTLPVTMNQKVEKFRLKASFEADLQAGTGRIWDREQAGIRLHR